MGWISGVDGLLMEGLGLWLFQSDGGLSLWEWKRLRIDGGGLH